jgi:hypothetical protein
MAPMLWTAAYCGASHPLLASVVSNFRSLGVGVNYGVNKPWCIADGIDGGRTLIARVEHASTIVTQCHSSKVLPSQSEAQDREY